MRSRNSGVGIRESVTDRRHNGPPASCRPITIALLTFLLTAAFTIAGPLEDQLLEASRNGNLPQVKELLEKGANVNAVNRYGTSALLFAASKGHIEVVRFLLEKGADPNLKDTFYGATPLGWAAEEGKDDIVKLLLQKGAEGADDVLMGSVVGKKAELVAWVLENAKVKSETLAGALAAAEKDNNTAMIDLLKKAGAASAALQTATQVDPQILKRYEGSYKRDDGNELKIRLEGQALMVEAIGQDPFALEAIDARTFKPSFGGFKAQFDEGEGPAVGFTVQRDDGSSSVYKRFDPAAVEAGPVPPATITAPATPGASIAKQGWPSFRGVNASGIGDGLNPPVKWDAEKSVNIAWKTPIPGLAHSSPVVWGDRIFITTAISSDPNAGLRTGLYGDVAPDKDVSRHTWNVYALDRKTGKIVWEHTAVEAVPEVKRHPKSTQANSTPATDGKHVVALFGSGDLICYDMNGKVLWKQDLGTLDSGWFYDPDYQWGYGSSPILYKDLVIVQADLQKNSALIAFELATGKRAWTTQRDEIPSWGTPTVIQGKTRAELVANGTNAVRGYDPESGKELWQVKGNSEITVPTPIFAHGLIYVTSGYRPVQPIYAIRPGGSGDISLKEGAEAGEYIVWSKSRGGPYMPTPIVYGDYLYTCANNGVVTVYNARTGEKVAQQRLGGKGNAYAFSASPVAADGRVYFSSEDGVIFAVRSAPPFDILSANPMGEVVMATPAIAEGMMIVRAQGHVYGISEKKE